MERKIRFGILGYARIARLSVIPALLQARNAEPYALASRKEQGRTEAKEKFGFAKVYEEYDELLADPDVDAVYIPLPNHLHREWTVRAARAGKHVLCEKPMGLSRAECEEMARACEENGVLLMEAFMYRFTTRTRKVRELLDAGAVGEVRRVSSSFRFVLDRPGDVRLNPEMGGGSLWDVGCYPVNFAGMVMGEEP
ncbi:MAG TPA: Gfo/Idh/MocA family oxidoreductase, partial [Candidatus Limnocylindria bacterium]|nr:Gfo/Idh/MocA family oxidoreductase [Candidatus Limnocylindria bacterium]